VVAVVGEKEKRLAGLVHDGQRPDGRPDVGRGGHLNASEVVAELKGKKKTKLQLDESGRETIHSHNCQQGGETLEAIQKMGVWGGVDDSTTQRGDAQGDVFH